MRRVDADAGDTSACAAAHSGHRPSRQRIELYDEVMRLKREGETTEKIARRVGKSPRTVVAGQNGNSSKIHLACATVQITR